ncbi:hypothetical protein Kpol_1039p32 [Vanderwaltozyma polyspora DSM 70294]|uniref:Histone deacetylase n=1 Tax=Vanderwaltozyma polyspora (strain ATCC 22028 / DSM 70294 / BCRC 21397 / CBS 2163 / NBRC 10782 / NRRL Y-8283 / UCD 57-17) TaxID=436907 RepID=A7THF9_VANPO|nr:uncharacterized protein Kpol_1039p32 [Vanderwaltozyma polyspora DSM 70294]EDO18283.1 hypothetical protein Kpol_1039p32 [Vanderwaltozyma polyspora DSM 70294]
MMSSLSYTPLKTGLCYDVRMRYHAKIYTSYYEYIDPHPEDPRRIYRIYKILAENGLIRDPALSGIDDIGDLMCKIPVREATSEEILEVHPKEQLEYLEKTQYLNRDELLSKTELGDSVYFNNDSYFSAKLSCGGAIEACKAIVDGKVKNSLAIVRPPGHHSEPEVAGGFCLFSNVAVATKNILKNYPDKVKKVMIVDWDIHHGNGTQKAFYNDDRVLYVSLHRFELGKYYPGTIHGQYDQVGEGKGEGFNCNIPWSVGGIGDAEYIWAFEQIVMPMGREFRPDLVIVSSGFDAADGDTIGKCHVTPSCYGHMTHMLKSLANGKLCVVLEGGYNLDAIARSALAVAKVLIGEPPDELPAPDKDPKPEAIEMIDRVIDLKSKYWKCFKRQITNSNCEYKGPISESFFAKKFPIQDAIRAQQIQYLTNDYNMVPLPLMNSNLPEDTVMCSTDILQSNVAIIYVHDTPEIWSKRDAIAGVIDSSASLYMDASLQFYDWALDRGYGIIDVNIPQTLYEQDNYSASLTAQEVLIKLWDNNLKYFPNVNKIAYIGVGEAYSGLVHLLGHRDTRSVVKSVIGFVGKKPLKALVPLVEESLADWYFKTSLLFADKNHSCWGENDSKKPRKRYGRVLRCDSDGIFSLIEERFEEATDFIIDSLDEWTEE